jgi:hypothetical protein
MISTSARRARRLGVGALTLALGGAFAFSALALPANAAPAPGFTVDQQRLLDTRSDAPTGPVQGFTQVQVSDDVPTGATVELTVTTTDSAGSGYITAYADGDTAPATSDLNYTATHPYAATVVVTVPADGDIDLNVVGAATQLVVDQQGYFSSSALTGVTPVRLADSRHATGFAKTGPQSGIVTLTIPSGTVPAGSGALALNVTAIASTSAGTGYVSVYSGGAPPATSSLNTASGALSSNLVFVTPSSSGTVSFNVAGVPANLVVDLEGYAPSGSTLVTASQRLADSRKSVGLPTGPLLGAQTLTVPTADVPSGTTAVVLNITAVSPSASGYLLAYPGTTKPLTSELQYAKGGTVAQTVVVPVTADANTVTIFIEASTQVVVDYEGAVTTG